MSPPRLRARDLGKSFGATRALADVAFDVGAGEIHALVGENGAGKSTLVNILSGVIEPDEGAIEIEGRAIDLSSPATAQQEGVATVHQELSLAENLSVAENIFAGRAPSRFGLVDRGRLEALTIQVFAEIGLAMNPNALVADLPMSSRQVVEIAKALARQPRILLLDEPTSALDAEEKAALFTLLRRIKTKGLGLVYISHHLDEVMALSDRVSVLRDGRVVAAHSTRETSPSQLVRDMVGRDIAANAAVRSMPGESVQLSARSLGRDGEFEDISFDLRAGEIVALAGLLGSGRSELAASLAGACAFQTGSATLEGAPFRPRSVAEAKRFRVGYIPAERKTEGLFLNLPVDLNVASASLEKVSRFGLHRPFAARATAKRYVEALRIRTRDVGDLCGSLSGGNQQKVMFAKWIETAPKLLIIEEPTKGVDVGAKADIHREMLALAAQGTAILFVSSDLPETLSVAHRVLVMHHGRLVADLDADDATERGVTELASGISRSAA